MADGWLLITGGYACLMMRQARLYLDSPVDMAWKMHYREEPAVVTGTHRRTGVSRSLVSTIFSAVWRRKEVYYRGLVFNRH